MTKDVKYIYFVEGETEAKAIKILKQDYIKSGKVVVLNQSRITLNRLRTVQKSYCVVLIFDTDNDTYLETLKHNVDILTKYNIDIVLIPQVKNFEDEIVYSTSITNITDLLESKSRSDFKSDFLRIANVLDKLKANNFDIQRFWSRNVDESSVFVTYKNTAHKIKL